MGKTANRLLFNSLWILWQKFGTRGITLILAVILARKLGTDSYGMLNYGLSLASLFLIFADLGLGTLVIREMSRDREEIPHYFGKVVTFKFFAMVVVFAIMVAAIASSHQDRGAYRILLLLGVSVFAQNMGFFYTNIFQALEKMHFGAIMETLQKVLLLLACTVIVYKGFGLTQVALAYAFVGLFVLAMGALISHNWFPAPVYQIDLAFYKILFRQSLPFAATALISTVYFRLDMIMLKHLQNAQAVGWYSVGYNLYFTLATAFGAFLAALFPFLSRLAAQSETAELDYVSSKAIKLIAALGLPLSIGGFLLSHSIIRLIFGNQYAPSGDAFQLFSLLIAVGFLNSFGTYFFAATNRAKIIVYLLLFTTCVNAALNVILIPGMSFYGAVYATIASELLFLVLFFANARNLLKYVIAWSILKCVLSASGMAIALVFLKRIHFPLLPSIAIGAFIYGVMLLAVQFLSADDIRILKGFLGKGEHHV